MKTIKNILALTMLIAVTFFMASCKKDSPAANPTTQEKILGKWKLQSLVQNDHYSGADHLSTYPGNSSEYYDFRTDGKVYAYVIGNYDTTAYGIIDDTHMWIDDNTEIYDIKTITGSAMQLYQKTIMGPDEYFEATVNFYK